MDVSVVIPCLNGEETIAHQLIALVNQETSAKYEVLVADNGSSDNTAGIVSDIGLANPFVRLVDASEARGINVARNRGVMAARGPLILVCDSDDLVHPGWIDAYWQAFNRGAMAMSGTVIRTTHGGVLGHDTGPYRIPGSRYAHAMGSNFGFVKLAFDAIGGFDEALFGGSDEIDFCWRLEASGFGIVSVPEAVVTYSLREGLGAVFRQHERYGRGYINLLQKHRSDTEVPAPHVFRYLGTVALAAGRLATSRPGTLRRRFGAERLGFGLGVLRQGMIIWRASDRHRDEVSTAASPNDRDRSARRESSRNQRQ